MSNIAIAVENIGKRYKLGGPGMGYFTLRDALSWRAGYLLNRLRGKLQHREVPPPFPPKPEFWALRNVSFEVKHGEVVGIIGRNGAGKSTLLKLLSRITEPTEGCARIRGRIGSLLEVGTGFHPELSGRENIYLNGAILGMRKAEIDRKFDEIVAFSEIEQFLDTPVKRYSSGMYVRLAFAVAAHLEPEILLVDEVLAVGDAAFQKKCLGKMGEVAKGGRTILFVSHNMGAIQSLCPKTLLLGNGQVIEFGESKHVISEYLKFQEELREWCLTDEDTVTRRSPYFTPTRLSLIDKSMNSLNRSISADEEIGILIEGNIEILNEELIIGFSILNQSGEIVFTSLHKDTNPKEWPDVREGHNAILSWIPSHLLNEGDYRIELYAGLYYREWICQPNVNSPGIHLSISGGLSESPFWITARWGTIAPILRFYNVP